ncbi:MAG: hypothetical protein JWR69_4405 [Pedosphaera sp.]|nr:hypothetical protein [Pedosphaera sp.]
MSGKGKEASDLANKYGWWWKDAKYHRTREENMKIWGMPHPLGANWKNVIERFAWGYELIRRVNRKVNLPSFGRLADFERQILPSLEDVFRPGPFRNALREGQGTEDGWTRSDALLQWNLNCSDAELSASFLQYIHGVRFTQGVKPPKKNQGRKNRPVSWRSHELLDLQECETQICSDSERSAISVAKKQGKILSRKLFDAVQKERQRLDPWLFSEMYPNFLIIV